VERSFTPLTALYTAWNGTELLMERYGVADNVLQYRNTPLLKMSDNGDSSFKWRTEDISRLCPFSETSRNQKPAGKPLAQLASGRLSQ
jgi:hypothetical protein